MLSIGVDIGGTKIRTGVVNEHGEILCSFDMPSWQYPTVKANIQEMLARMTSMIDRYGRERFTFIGIGVPGTVDVQRRDVVYTPNLRWFDIPLANIVEEAMGIQTKLTQDAKAAAFAEYTFGVGKGYNTVSCVTIGTGIAAGTVCGGHVLYGLNNVAGEIGHQIVEWNGILCGCGRLGCMEAYCSGLGMPKLLELEASRFEGKSELLGSNLYELSASTIFDHCRRDDPLAQHVISRAVYYLGIGLTNFLCAVSPEVLVLSGGLSREPLLVHPVIDFIRKNAYRTIRDAVRVEVSPLGQDGPLIGAAIQYMEN